MDFIDYINRRFNDAIAYAADQLGVEPHHLLVCLALLWSAFAFGFAFGYELSCKQFLDAINKHQIENGKPPFTRVWLHI